MFDMEVNAPIPDIAYIELHAEEIPNHRSDITREEIALVNTKFQRLKEWQRILGKEVDDALAPLFQLYRKTFAVA